MTIMNNDYPDEMEKLDDKYLKFFNDHKKFFIIPNTTERETEKYSIIDRQLTDTKNRPCAIELKTRMLYINTYDTLFLEEKKWEALKEEYINNNKIPLFINFFYDHRQVLIYDLRKYFDKKTEQPKKIYLDINNWGYGRIDRHQSRYLLPQRDGIFYEFDQEQDKYIKKWG